MSNAFDYYDQLRKQQIHFHKIINPQLRVPNHEAYKPIKAKIQEARLKQRIKKQASIDRQNQHIIKKLCNINKRKPELNMNHSTPSFSLPPIILQRKLFQIPKQEKQNDLIAKKIINSKSSINVQKQLKEYNQMQQFKRSISKYHSIQGYNGSQIFDRKRYIAELMMLKKIKLSQQTESRIKNYINSDSRISKINSEKNYHSNT